MELPVVVGTLVAKDDDEAMKLFCDAEKKGSVEAQNKLGLMYRDGYQDTPKGGKEQDLNQDLKQDLNKAICWFKKAAGNSARGRETEWVVGASRNNLGDMYDRGYGELECLECALDQRGKVSPVPINYYSSGEVSFRYVVPDYGREFQLGTRYRRWQGARRARWQEVRREGMQTR